MRPFATGWLTQGPEVLEFEKEFAAYVGAPYACAVSSCTTALHLALLVAGVKPGDEVISVSHSFIATANAIRYCDAKPVFCDIEPGTFNLNPLLLESLITPKTRAILCVHQLGMPCDLTQILQIAKRHALVVIEDAACAIGSEIFYNEQWEKIGKPHGDIACFSFHPRKVLTTGDGGMLTTSRPEWDEKFRSLRQHGMSVSDAKRHGAKEVIFEAYPVVGYNYRMTDFQAAIGRVQLERLPEMLAKRRYLAARYRELLEGKNGLILPEEPAWARSNWQSFCVRLPEDIEVKKVMQVMLDQQIATRRGVMCIHREEAYSSQDASCGHDKLKQSENAQDHCLMLPLFSQMTEAEQDRVCSALVEACGLVKQS